MIENTRLCQSKQLNMKEETGHKAIKYGRWIITYTEKRWEVGL
jgi:hypothetical protein